MQYSNADDYFRERLRIVAEYLQFRNVPSDLRRKVRSFYAFTFRRSGELYDEAGVLSELSEPLRLEVLREIGARAWVLAPLLDGFDAREVGTAFTRMRALSLVKGQIVYKCGDRADDMYFVASGTVVLFPDGMDNGSTPQTAGEAVGEAALVLSDDDMPGLRTETAVATEWSSVYSLSCEDADALRSECPLVRATLVPSVHFL